jgi:hypothetical protein
MEDLEFINREEVLDLQEGEEVDILSLVAMPLFLTRQAMGEQALFLILQAHQ